MGTKKESSRRDNLSKYFYDLSKMTLAATVLALVPSFLEEEFTLTWRTAGCFLIGISLTIIFAMAGNKVMKY